MLDKAKKEKIIEKFKTHAKDTGSPQVQIAILSAEIDDLAGHLKEHKKDLLKYLEREDAKGHAELVEKLKLK
jgi:small subunit ribosomal protein S15